MAKFNFDLEAILDQLGDWRRDGMCRCPAHDDHKPSLHVSKSATGKILFHCFRGCKQDAVIRALQKLGDQTTFLARAIKASAPDNDDEAYEKFRKAYSILRAGTGCLGPYRQWQQQQRNPREKVRLYLQGRGIDKVPKNVLYLLGREAAQLTNISYPAMVFPIIGPNGMMQGAHVTFLSSDGAENARSDGKNMRRFYGSVKQGYIPLGATNRDKPVIVAEGVETALAAGQITGLPAIAALSANNMKVITPPLSSEVIVVPDNDESGVGQAAAKELAQRLTSTGRTVRIVELERPEGQRSWDCNDELKRAREQGRDLAALREKMLSSAEFKRVGEVSDLVQPLGMEEFNQLVFPKREHLLKPWLTTTGLVMIDAQPGHGKTWLALSIAYAVASGKSLLEWQPDRAARVLYVDGELPGELLQSRLRMLGAPVAESNLLVLSRAQFELYGKLIPDLATEDGRGFLDKVIEANEIELIILDSVSTLVRSGEDNDVESWRAIQDWSLKHRGRGRAVIYLHHQGKSKTPRGTSSREIVLDTRISMSLSAELTTEHETAFKLEFPKAREFHGADTVPMVAYLSTQSGVVEWRRETVKNNNRARVKELHQQGMQQSDIAKEIGIGRSWVSQLVKEFEAEKMKVKLFRGQAPKAH